MAASTAKQHADFWAPELVELVSHVRTGEPRTFEGTVVVPLLFTGNGKAPDADLLDEALERGKTTVDEVSPGGDVPKLRVIHRGKRPLLLLDGEQVLGGKQNRIFNTSFVILPGVSVEVPVSCVEAGRWHRTSSQFASSGSTLHARARARKLDRVITSITTRDSYDACQGAVWGDVDEFLCHTGSLNDTAAYSVGETRRMRDSGHRLEELKPQPHQIGIALVRGRKLVSLDLFGSPELYARAWSKIARGILSDAYDEPVRTPRPVATVDAALERIRRTKGKRNTPAPGCGETLHGSTRALRVGAVAHDGAVYHAVAAGV